MPDTVRRKAGAELRLVQQGERPDSAENVEGYAGNSVLKLKLLYDTDTYRVVYTVSVSRCRVCMKKAHTEDKTPQKELNTIAARLKTAQARYEEMKMPKSSNNPTSRLNSSEDEQQTVESSGNVFEDLGLQDAEELLAKTDMAIILRRLVREAGLTQSEAVARLGIDASQLSELVNGHTDGFSLETLLRFVNALNRNVRIVVEERETASGMARTQVLTAA